MTKLLCEPASQRCVGAFKSPAIIQHPDNCAFASVCRCSIVIICQNVKYVLETIEKLGMSDTMIFCKISRYFDILIDIKISWYFGYFRYFEENNTFWPFMFDIIFFLSSYFVLFIAIHAPASLSCMIACLVFWPCNFTYSFNFFWIAAVSIKVFPRGI